MNDLVITFVNVLFALLVTMQIYKNYKVKDVRSHSYIWHGVTCAGFIILAYEYTSGGYLFSTVTILLNFIFRLIIIIQMLYYNRKMNKVSNWM